MSVFIRPAEFVFRYDGGPSEIFHIQLIVPGMPTLEGDFSLPSTNKFYAISFAQLNGGNPDATPWLGKTGSLIVQAKSAEGPAVSESYGAQVTFFEQLTNPSNILGV